LERPFFQLPNQSRTTWRLFFRAPERMPSTREKSYLPSTGSTQFQPTPTRTVLRLALATFGHTASINARSDEAVLSVSPASARYGLPSTINCVAAPRFSRWGICALAATASASKAMDRIAGLMADLLNDNDTA